MTWPGGCVCQNRALPRQLNYRKTDAQFGVKPGRFAARKGMGSMAATLKEYDVCIVGSGAAGGIMAKELSEGGAQVVLLEGGRRVDPSEFLSHKWPYELQFQIG